MSVRSRFAHTLPLWPVGPDGRCTCPVPGCKRPGKHPDPKAPGPGYAVVTGETNGLFVVDPDVKGGIDGIRQLADFLGVDEKDLPETLTVETPSGGLHLYFQHPGFRVANRKPASAVDIKGDPSSDDGLVYVVGPESPGYERTNDPCVVRPSEPYTITVDAPIAPAPEHLLAWLRIGPKKTQGSPVTPITPEHPDWTRRVQLAVQACTEYPASQGDGEASKRLVRLAFHLAVELQLPLDVARDLVLEHWDPRCTHPDGRAWPWGPEEIERALASAAQQDDPTRHVLPEATISKISRLADPNAAPTPPPEKSKDKVDANVAYDGERKKVTRTAVTQMLYSWPDWDGVLWFDVLAQKPRATNPPVAGKMTLEQGEMSKGDLALMAHWFDSKGFLVSKELIEDALWTVVRAPDRQRNIIAEYLDSLPPVNSATVLPTLATDVMGATSEDANLYVMKTLVAAARRARNPGAFHKAMLVLRGRQQCGKTPFVKILAEDWYQTTGNGNLAERDTILECQGKLLVEVEELSALNKADADALKTAISRTHDPITKKYEPDARNYPRSFTLIGTTNKDEFLTDSSGNARYWVVDVGQIDLARLKALRDVIWAEADFLARSGYSNELAQDEAARLEQNNKAYLDSHPWTGAVIKYLAGKERIESATDVLLHILKGDESKADQRALRQVADIMRNLGCTQQRTTKRRFWSVPKLDAPPAKVIPFRKT